VGDAHRSRRGASVVVESALVWHGVVGEEGVGNARSVGNLRGVDIPRVIVVNEGPAGILEQGVLSEVLLKASVPHPSIVVKGTVEL